MVDPVVTAIIISLGSYHINKDPNEVYQQVNPGVVVELNHDYVVGAYRNSRDKITALAGYRYNLADLGPINVRVLLAACSGYDYPVCGAINATWGPITTIITPPIKDHAAAIGFAFRWEIK